MNAEDPRLLDGDTPGRLFCVLMGATSAHEALAQIGTATANLTRLFPTLRLTTPEGRHTRPLSFSLAMQA